MDDLTDGLRKIRGKQPKKMHWYGSAPAVKAKVATLIAEYWGMHWVAVETVTHSTDSERMRNRCMRNLFYELNHLNVTNITMESRGPASDRRDVDLTRKLRDSHLIDAGLRVGHEIGANQPLLWVADAICGVVSDHTFHGDSRWFETLKQRVFILNHAG